MEETNATGRPSDGVGASRVGLVSVGALVALTAFALAAGDGMTNAPKLVGIAWVAFAAMAVAIPLGARSHGENARPLVWGYGLASGAMVTSAAVFLVPQAVAHHTQYGGFGVALGLLVGFAGHTVAHQFSHLDLPVDRTVAELTVHALSAGAVIGVVYGNMPDLGLTLGLAIVSHKGPAGYAAATRLARRGRDPWVILAPATGVGVAGILAGLVSLPAAPAVRGVVFGFAAGIFLHVAMDFLPRCEIGSDIHELAADGDDHATLDRLRIHAVLSTALGGLAVFLAWLALA